MKSFTGLPGYGIPSEDGINTLTGEKDGKFKIKKLDIWSLA